MFNFPFYTDKADELQWEEITNHFSWVKDMIDVPQDHIWHAEGNVNIHTKLVTQSLLNLDEFHKEDEQAKRILFISALMHDIEKRSTTLKEYRDDEKRECIVAPSHARKGEFTARNILYKEFDCPFEIREQICKLVRWHGTPLWAHENSDPLKTIAQTSLHIPNRWLAMIAKADVLGRVAKDQDDYLLRVEIFEELCKKHGAWDAPVDFKSDLGRFLYFLDDEKTYPLYEPFDDFSDELIIMCGLPGAGKSTYVSNHYPNHEVVSMDAIRAERGIKRGDKKEEGRMIQDVKEMTKDNLRNKRPMVWDATSITTLDRSKLIGLAFVYKVKPRIVYIETPYKTLLEQNKNRDKKVPEDTIHGYLWSLEIPCPTEAVEVKHIIQTETK